MNTRLMKFAEKRNNPKSLNARTRKRPKRSRKLNKLANARKFQVHLLVPILHQVLMLPM